MTTHEIVQSALELGENLAVADRLRVLQRADSIQAARSYLASGGSWALRRAVEVLHPYQTGTDPVSVSIHGAVNAILLMMSTGPEPWDYTADRLLIQAWQAISIDELRQGDI